MHENLPIDRSSFSRLLLVLTLLAVPPSCAQAVPASTSSMSLQTAGAANGSATFDAAAEAQLVALINEARAQHGLSQLTVEPRLTEAARKHAQLMAEHGALSHQFETEAPIEKRFAAEDLASDREGENVDLDHTVASVHAGLMDSPPHRHNILNAEYNVVGVGVIRHGPYLFVTEDFAHRLPRYSEPETEELVRNAVEQYERSHGFSAPQRKPQPQLRRIACDLALSDTLEAHNAAQLPEVRAVFAWTAGDPGKLPPGSDRILSQGLPAGYALGACFAPSVSHPGGVYWIVMVSY